jgi:2-methylcitrate dehydratase PrpD
VLWPALIALGETIEATGRQLSAAYAVGYELFMMPAISKILDHYARGHHSTSTLGLIAGTAACANLMGLDAGKATMAIGMAASHACGLQANFGTMTKPLHAGIAAAAAVRSVQLARRGFTASPGALDGAQGFAGAYTMPDFGADMEGLGKEPLSFGTLGFSIKKFPCCLSVHIAVQTVLDMLAEQPIRPGDVERIKVTVEPRGLKALIHHRPTSGLQGKFSMQYCVAAALIDGAIGLQSFTDEAVRRPEVQALLRKVEIGEDGGELRPLRAAVEIELSGGRRLARKLDRLPGSPEQPLSDADVEQKFRSCAAFSGLEFDTDGFLAAMADWADRPIRSVLATIAKQ